jgi:hypothetical protein
MEPHATNSRFPLFHTPIVFIDAKHLRQLTQRNCIIYKQSNKKTICL